MENWDSFPASQPTMEPCCSSPQTVTCLFSDSGSGRCRGTPNVFASLKRDFRAQWKCVCTVRAFISRRGWGRKRTGPGSGVHGPVNTARSRATSIQKLLLTWQTAPGYGANLKRSKSVFRSDIYQTTQSETKSSRNCSEVLQILNIA